MKIERMPSARPPERARVVGAALRPSAKLDFEVIGAQRLSLGVAFPDQPPLEPGEVFSDVTLHIGDNIGLISLGRCRFEAMNEIASLLEGEDRDSNAPPIPAGAQGKLVPLDQIVNCRELVRSGRRITIADTFEQLPLLFARKDEVCPAFQQFTADLVYDLRIYRQLFDDIDADLASESEATRADVERAVFEGQGRRLMRFFNERIDALGDLVRPFSRSEHERHGFYFRRQLWDVILSVPILARTNTRPRGYAGDWVMMAYIYQNEYLGPNLFGKILHKNTMEVPASQAVRSRLRLIAETITAARKKRGPGEAPLKFLSVACGPAFELEDIFVTAEDCERSEIVLLDQDEEALAQAELSAHAVEQRTGRPVNARFVRGSVRTMLRKRGLSERLGKFHVIYSMGLFDYLTAPVAKAVLSRLYDLLEPGGQIVVGNYHVANPSRWYMEYWADWTLIHRTEEDLLALAADLRGAECTLSFEETRCQMFLAIRKTPGR